MSSQIQLDHQMSWLQQLRILKLCSFTMAFFTPTHHIRLKAEDEYFFWLNPVDQIFRARCFHQGCNAWLGFQAYSFSTYSSPKKLKHSCTPSTFLNYVLAWGYLVVAFSTILQRRQRKATYFSLCRLISFLQSFHIHKWNFQWKRNFNVHRKLD